MQGSVLLISAVVVGVQLLLDTSGPLVPEQVKAMIDALGQQTLQTLGQKELLELFGAAPGLPLLMVQVAGAALYGRAGECPWKPPAHGIYGRNPPAPSAYACSDSGSGILSTLVLTDASSNVVLEYSLTDIW